MAICTMDRDAFGDERRDQLDQSFMYTQILKEIIFEIKYNEQSIKDLVTYCRDLYAGNQNELQIIEELFN